jgi:hypothetical protein
MKPLHQVSDRDCIYMPVIFKAGSVSCFVVILLRKSGLTLWIVILCCSCQWEKLAEKRRQALQRLCQGTY